jgi:hypothetical protein
MPAAIYTPNLDEIQIAQEAAWGDAAAPTIGLAGITECEITPHNDAYIIQDKRASTMPGYIAAIPRLWGECTIKGIVSYTQIQYFLNAMFTIDAATPFTYLAALAPAAPQSLNIMWGQANLSYGMAGALCDRLVISGDTNGPLMFEAHFIGKFPVALARVALTPPTPIIAMGFQTLVAVDTIATAHGTTPLVLTGYSYAMEILNSRHPTFHLGTENPDNFVNGQWGGSLRLILEGTAATKAYLTSILAATLEPTGYNIRLQSDGPNTADLTQDFAGVLISPPVLYTEQEGVTTFEFDFSPIYSAQAGILSCWKFSNVAS